MPVTRQERVALHKKQERLIPKEGVPSVADLKEGVPVFRSTTEGVVEYLRYKGVLHKKVFDRAGSKKDINFQYAYFGVNYYDFSNMLVDIHYAVPFIFGGTTSLNDVPFGGGTDPDDTFTTGGTNTQYASQLVPMLWHVPESITIDSVSHIEGADAATGDTTRMHLKSFIFTSGVTACLTAGKLLAYSPDRVNAGYEQPYLSNWSVDSAEVVNKVILCFIRADSISSDYSLNVTVKYHLN